MSKVPHSETPNDGGIVAGSISSIQSAGSTPEISVINFDFRRHSKDLKKHEICNPITSVTSPTSGAATSMGQVLNKSKPDLSQDVDSDVISNFIGHYSRWSIFWAFMLSLFQLPTTFHMFMFVFQTVDKSFWCARPEHLMHVNASEWMRVSQTATGCAILDWDWSTVEYNGSSWLNLPSTPAGSQEDAADYISCKRFEFDTVGDGADKTLVEEFQLICGRRNLLSVVEMCFLAGAAVGSVSSGWISDRFGRRHTLMAFATMQTIFGGILAFSPSLSVFMTLRVIIGFASMTVTIVSFVLVVELVSGKWRTIIGILNILPVSLAYVLAAAIAFYIRNWRTLQLVISWPWLALLCIWYWLPESPRWLLARGRLDELCEVIERAARMNARTLPDGYRKTLEAAVPNLIRTKRLRAADNESDAAVSAPKDSDQKPKANINENPFLIVFNHVYWRTTCLTLVVWLTLIIIYFGLTLHLSNLGGNIYLNTAVAGIVEAISICISIFVVLRIGIRYSLIAYMLVPGLCCLGTLLVPEAASGSGVIALAIIAKCLIGANNAIIPTYTAMQYPTIVRNFGVGMGNLAAGIGLILVPYLWLLEHFNQLLPLTIMGVCGLIGAVALVLMKDVDQS